MPCDKLAMPSKNRVRRGDRSDFLKDLSPENLSLDAQAALLVVAEEDSLLPKLLPEHSIFGYEVGDHILLPMIHPTRENQKQQLPRLEKSLHRILTDAW